MGKKILFNHEDRVLTINVLKNGDLVSGSSDKTIKIWDKDTGKLKKTLTGHTDYVKQILVLPNGNLVSASFDFTIKVWNPDL